MDLTSAAGKKQKIDEMLVENCEEFQKQPPQEELVSDESFKYCTPSTDEELNELFEALLIQSRQYYHWLNHILIVMYLNYHKKHSQSH